MTEDYIIDGYRKSKKEKKLKRKYRFYKRGGKSRCKEVKNNEKI